MARSLARHGKPDIFNTDQGSQFTGAAFTGVLSAHAIAISMDGKAAWRDNIFVERLWRSVKYQEVYLRAYDGVSDARASIGRYLDFSNRLRPDASLDGATPDQAYSSSRTSVMSLTYHPGWPAPIWRSRVDLHWTGGCHDHPVSDYGDRSLTTARCLHARFRAARIVIQRCVERGPEGCSARQGQLVRLTPRLGAGRLARR